MGIMLGIYMILLILCIFNKYSRIPVTVRLPIECTTEELQKIIDDCPKDLNKYTPTFQFDNGIYNWSEKKALIFSGYSGEGTLTIKKDGVINDTYRPN